EISLGAYKEVEAEREPVNVTEEDVDRSLAALAKERAILAPVDRPAALGDVVTMDYEGKVDGVAFEGGTATGQMTELDESRFIPGFVAGIAGMKAGETKEVEADFPQDYGASELAGKRAAFTIVLHEVKAYELPALDDEFAKSISGSETYAQLRDDVRKRLEAISEARVRRLIGNVVMEKLIAAHDFPLPDSLVDREVGHMLGETESQVQRAGMTFEAYLKDAGKTEDELRSDYRADAQIRVKGTLLIEAVAKAENIAATPADIAEELTALARQYGQPIDQIRKSLGNNVVSLMDGIVRNKTLEFLIDNAKVVDKK
ncbi:MAG: trigger factor, partial [Candidatus Baltobacteraceae bacterium]